MNYKEKYKRALERAQQAVDKGQVSQNFVDDIFAEHKLSRDERIRKAIKKALQVRCDGSRIISDEPVTLEEALAWLEKQKVTDEEIIFRPIVGTDIRIAAKQALEKINIGKKVVLAFNGAYISVNGKTVGEIDSEYDAWLKKQGGNKPTDNVEIKFCEGDKVMSAYEIGFIEGAVWADAHPHWISVEDELPKIGKDVLVLREDGEMQVAHQYNEEIARWWSVDGFPLKNNITHWMPLPQPPKEGGEK